MKKLIEEIIKDGTSIEFRPDYYGIKIIFSKFVRGNIAHRDLIITKKGMEYDEYLEASVKGVFNLFKKENQ